MKLLTFIPVCPGCDVPVGSYHKNYCDVEQCPFCGKQKINCWCIYAYFGIQVDTMQQEYPKIFTDGFSEEMLAIYEAHLAPFLLPWEGVWPGTKECREYGFWATLTPDGWQTCDPDDPEATEDVNELHRRTFWDKEKHRFVLREK